MCFLMDFFSLRAIVLIIIGFESEGRMKRKPDTMVAMVLIFCIGLIVSGFSSMTNGTSEERSVEQAVTRY